MQHLTKICTCEKSWSVGPTLVTQKWQEKLVTLWKALHSCLVPQMTPLMTRLTIIISIWKGARHFDLYASNLWRNITASRHRQPVYWCWKSAWLTVENLPQPRHLPPNDLCSLTYIPQKFPRKPCPCFLSGKLHSVLSKIPLENMRTAHQNNNKYCRV